MEPVGREYVQRVQSRAEKNKPMVPSSLRSAGVGFSTLLLEEGWRGTTRLVAHRRVLAGVRVRSPPRRSSCRSRSDHACARGGRGWAWVARRRMSHELLPRRGRRAGLPELTASLCRRGEERECGRSNESVRCVRMRCCLKLCRVRWAPRWWRGWTLLTWVASVVCAVAGGSGGASGRSWFGWTGSWLGWLKTSNSYWKP